MNASVLRRARLLASLLTAATAASAQMRGRAVEIPVVAVPVGVAAVSVVPSVSLPALAPTVPSLATAPSLTALPAAAAAPEAAASIAASAAPALAPVAAAAEVEPLWAGGMPAADARKMLDAAHWETTKFFFTSRVKLLREMIEAQKAETAGKLRAVEDLEGMWLDWRVKAYSGRVTTAGFEVADRGTIRREAEALFDRRFPKDAASRAAFRRYLDRVDAYVPVERPSNYRKLAFGVFYELPTVAPAELPARMDAMLAAEHLGAIALHRATAQEGVLASFKQAALASIAEVNAGLPKGKRVVSVILLGSYAIRQSTPKSDIDYQLMTEDGSSDAIAPFMAALDRNWKENRIEKLEAFQFALPPSREVVVESFKEGYQVVSPDPRAVEALSKDAFAPDAVSRWSRLRGQAFGAFYRAWCWSYLRLADFCELLTMSTKK